MNAWRPGSSRRSGSSIGKPRARASRDAFTFDVDRALELTGAGARVLLAVFVVTQVTLAVAAGGRPMQTWHGVVALILVIGGAIVAVAPGTYPLRWHWTAAILGVVVLSTALMNWQLVTSEWPGYSSWHFGANTFLLLAVALRGRALYAWAGMAAMTALTVAWTLSTGQGIMPAVDLLERQAGTLLIGTLFAVGFARTMRSVQQFTESQNRSAVRQQASAAALEVRDRRLSALEQRAVPVLHIIEGGATLDAAARRELLIVEAMLRDSIRGGMLACEPLVSSAGQARRRGVEVLLVDDSGRASSHPDGHSAAATWAAEQLGTVTSGTFTARVVTHQNALVVTVVAEQLGQRVLELPYREAPPLQAPRNFAANVLSGKRAGWR